MEQIDLSVIVNIVEILGILALSFGVWLGIKQLRLQRSQRRDLAIIECARFFENKEFAEAYGLITELNPGISIEKMNALDPKYKDAVLRTGMKFETIGLLVYKDVVPIDAMHDLVGDAAIQIWKILENYIIESRIERSHSTLFEWYQWLVDRLREQAETKAAPAYVTYKDWKNPN